MLEDSADTEDVRTTEDVDGGQLDVDDQAPSAVGAVPVGGVELPPSAPRGRRFRSLISGAPIVGFTGPNGSGKTLVAVSEAIHDMRQGRRVVSTVQIHSPWGDSEPLLSLRQLLELRDCTVLVDEVAAVFSSRANGALPPEVDLFLQSMRHQEVTFRWTAPAWARADIRLREITQVSVGTLGLARFRPKGQFWPRPRIILAGALDTTQVKTDGVPTKIIGRRLWIPQRLPGWGAYDSLADVPRVGLAGQSGSCIDCGGTVKREPCTPDRHQVMGIPPRLTLAEYSSASH